MITEKFNYKDIPREKIDGNRLYATASGRLPSVTTILSRTTTEDKRAGLQAWRDRVGHAEAQRITTEAGNVGTIMHNTLEHWVKGIDYNAGDNMIHRIAKKMAKTVIENIEPDLGEVWGSEVKLYYPDMYAGTTDLVGMWKGKPTIMDFKQTNKPKKAEWIEDYYLQGSAYGLAHNAMFDTKIENVAIFMCSRDCTWQLFELDADGFAEYSSKWALRVGQFYDLNK